MAEKIKRRHDWGMFFVGIMLVVCAAILVMWPGATLVTIALMAGIMLLFAGGADFAAFLSAKGQQGRGWILLNAFIDVILGAMFFAHPIIASAVIPWIAGIFIIGYGILAAITAFAVRSMGSGWVLMLVNAMISVIIGIMFVLEPAYFVWFLGIYLAMRGILMCIFGVAPPKGDVVAYHQA